MILSQKEIRRRLGSDIHIEPFDEKRLNTNSYNLRLHDELLVYSEPELDMKKDNPFSKMRIPTGGLVLQPGKLYLGRTCEYTKTYNLVPMLDGRSSTGRLGLFIHATAGFGDIGFEGYWTLEIQCVQPVKVYPFVEVCQIHYHTIEGEYENVRYSGKYQSNEGIQTSQIFKELT